MDNDSLINGYHYQEFLQCIAPALKYPPGSPEYKAFEEASHRKDRDAIIKRIHAERENPCTPEFVEKRFEATKIVPVRDIHNGDYCLIGGKIARVYYKDNAQVNLRYRLRSVSGTFSDITLIVPASFPVETYNPKYVHQLSML